MLFAPLLISAFMLLGGAALLFVSGVNCANEDEYRCGWTGAFGSVFVVGAYFVALAL